MHFLPFFTEFIQHTNILEYHLTSRCCFFAAIVMPFACTLIEYSVLYVYLFVFFSGHCSYFGSFSISSTHKYKCLPHKHKWTIRMPHNITTPSIHCHCYYRFYVEELFGFERDNEWSGWGKMYVSRLCCNIQAALDQLENLLFVGLSIFLARLFDTCHSRNVFGGFHLTHGTYCAFVCVRVCVHMKIQCWHCQNQLV